MEACWAGWPSSWLSCAVLQVRMDGSHGCGTDLRMAMPASTGAFFRSSSKQDGTMLLMGVLGAPCAPPNPGSGGSALTLIIYLDNARDPGFPPPCKERHCKEKLGFNNRG